MTSSARDYLSFLIATPEAQRSALIRARAHLSVSALIGDRLDDPEVSARALAVYAHLGNAADSIEQAKTLIRAIGDDLPAALASELVAIPLSPSAEGYAQ